MFSVRRNTADIWLFIIQNLKRIYLAYLYSKEKLCITDSNPNHTGIYIYSKGKIMIHLIFDYKSDKDCATSALADALGIERNRLLDTYAAFVGYPCSTVRAELSISQMQFAEKIGVSQTAYSSWERSSQIPRRKEYEKIIMALKESGAGIAPYLSKQISA